MSGHPTAKIIFFGPNFNAWPGILTCDSLVKTFYYMSKEFFSDRHGKNPPFFFSLSSAFSDALPWKKDSKKLQ